LNLILRNPRLGLTTAALVGCVAIFASGCAGHKMHALTSEAPASIELTAPAIVSDQGATTTFPPGKYKPAFEDEHGYYYEAPKKVLIDDVAVYAFEGGVYVERGHTAPTRWYVIRPNGRRTMGRFKTPPSYEIVKR
jgi:hypothetical protein